MGGRVPDYYRSGGVINTSTDPELGHLSKTVDEIDEYDEGMSMAVFRKFDLRIRTLQTIITAKGQITPFSPEDLKQWLNGVVRIIRTHIQDPKLVRKIAEDIFAYEVKNVRLEEMSDARSLPGGTE